MISKKIINLSTKIMKNLDKFNLLENDSQEILTFRYFNGENFLDIEFSESGVEFHSSLEIAYGTYTDDYGLYSSYDTEESMGKTSIEFIRKDIILAVENFDKLWLNLSIRVDPIKLESIVNALDLGKSDVDIEYDDTCFGAKIIIDIDEFDLELAKKVTEFLRKLKTPEAVSEPLEQKCSNNCYGCWCDGKCSSGGKETAFTANQKKVVESYMNKIWEEIESAAKLCNKK